MELDQPAADIYTFEGGWAIRYDDYWEPEEALKAAKVSTTDSSSDV
jgi:hypothetical protein